MTKLVALGSLLTLSFLISGCGAHSPYYGEMSTAKSYTAPTSAITIATNMLKHNAYSVPREGRYKHENCVYFALDNLDIGQNCEWATPSAIGNVQVIQHYPAGSGYCTVLLNSVYYKKDTRAWRDTACTDNTGKNWKFIKS